MSKSTRIIVTDMQLRIGHLKKLVADRKALLTAPPVEGKLVNHASIGVGDRERIQKEIGEISTQIGKLQITVDGMLPMCPVEDPKAAEEIKTAKAASSKAYAKMVKCLETLDTAVADLIDLQKKESKLLLKFGFEGNPVKSNDGLIAQSIMAATGQVLKDLRMVEARKLPSTMGETGNTKNSPGFKAHWPG